MMLPLWAEAPRATERFSTGPARDGGYPDAPIAAWDDKAAMAQIDALILRMQAEGIPDSIRQLAASEATKVSEVTGEIVKTRETQAYDMITPVDGSSPSDEMIRNGRYILLHSARDGDPWVLFNLGNFYSDVPDANVAEDFSVSLYRLAADREFVPAIVNLSTALGSSAAETDPAIREAYLRHGFDLDVPDANYQVTIHLLEFYGSEHTDRPNDGYFQRGLDRLAGMGEQAERKQYEAFALIYGDALPQDAAKGVGLLQELLAEPDTRFHNYSAIGYSYAVGRMGPPDPEVARDYYVACLQNAPTTACALNLGSYFRRPSDGFDQPVEALAFYELARTMALQDGEDETLRIIEDEIAGAKVDLPFFGAARKVEAVRALIAAGKFTEIDGLQQTRVVP